MEEYTEFKAPTSRKIERVRPLAKNGRNTNLTYFLIGCGVGAVGALLFSPRFGKEMREKLSDVALIFASKLGDDLRAQIDKTTERGFETARGIIEDLAEKGRETLLTIVEEAKGTIARSTDQLSGVIEEAKETLVKSADRLSEAIESGKQAYIEEKRKVEEGGIYHGTSSL
jgi:gas vesicle protein